MKKSDSSFMINHKIWLIFMTHELMQYHLPLPISLQSLPQSGYWLTTVHQLCFTSKKHFWGLKKPEIVLAHLLTFCQYTKRCSVYNSVSFCLKSRSKISNRSKKIHVISTCENFLNSPILKILKCSSVSTCPIYQGTEILLRLFSAIVVPKFPPSFGTSECNFLTYGTGNIFQFSDILYPSRIFQSFLTFWYETVRWAPRSPSDNCFWNGRVTSATLIMTNYWLNELWQTLSYQCGFEVYVNFLKTRLAKIITKKTI